MFRVQLCISYTQPTSPSLIDLQDIHTHLSNIISLKRTQCTCYTSMFVLREIHEVRNHPHMFASLVTQVQFCFHQILMLPVVKEERRCVRDPLNLFGLLNKRIKATFNVIIF